MKHKLIEFCAQYLLVVYERLLMYLCICFLLNPLNQILNKIDLLKKVDSSSQSTIFLGSLGVGFGNLKATAENTPPGFEESKSSEAADLLINVASSCCNRLIDHCCCMCFIQTCSSMNKQCSIVFSQICAALACFECISCCFEVCECF